MAKSKTNNTNDKILMIVESPNKKATLTQILRDLGYNNIVVNASVGHICEIRNSGEYNIGIDIDNNFKIDFVVSDDKKKVVNDLKEQVKNASKVILSSDPDREGEAIAYHLKNFLKIPEKKYERVTFHEITKSAVKEALEHPRKIDMNLVQSALSRAVADKIIGFRLSKLVQQAVNCKSAGRCQTPALGEVVLREEEISKFISKTYYELYLNFIKDKVEYQAKYVGNSKKKISQFDNKDDVDKIIKGCKGNDFVISNIEYKQRQVSPKPPFKTSTFQQECSNKLGMSVDTAMAYAKRLFEGINVNGQHIALVTYIRTDSTNISKEFEDTMKEFTINKYGKKYYSPIRQGKKKETDQDGHECLRCVNIQLLPELLEKYTDDKKLIEVYKLIYNRTLASNMSNAIINDTVYTINNKDNQFQMTLSQLYFDGFKLVYGQYKDDEDDVVGNCSLIKNEILTNTKLNLVEKETKPPKRYSEAGLVKRLEDLGIGRPSTFGNIIKTILDSNRGYSRLENKSFVPTDKGIELIHFLYKEFNDIIGVDFTAKLESKLDDIANGKLTYESFIKEFYYQVDNAVNKVSKSNLFDIDKAKLSNVCPQCGKPLTWKKGPFGNFQACSGYPECRYIKKNK